jgi:hypothetical protein
MSALMFFSLGLAHTSRSFLLLMKGVLGMAKSEQGFFDPALELARQMTEPESFVLKSALIERELFPFHSPDFVQAQASLIEKGVLDTRYELTELGRRVVFWVVTFGFSRLRRS